MTNYLLLYQGRTDPAWQPTPEQAEAMTQSWGAWIGKHQSSLTDIGAPTGERARVGSGAALPITGYTVVEAGSLDEARAMCDGHPFLDGAPADFSIDVYRLEPIEM